MRSRNAIASRSTWPSGGSILLFCFGLSLNQTSVVFGMNLSLADGLAVILLAVAALTSKLYLPVIPTLFFTALSVLVLFVSGFVAPTFLSVVPDVTNIFSDYIKLVTSFCYFILGVSLAKAYRSRIVLLGFVFTAVFVGLLGVLQTALPGSPRMDFMFLGDHRFRGIMNDPNYFAIIQVAALALLWHDTTIKPKVRYPALAILVLSVLASGSKTGALTLLAFLLWRTLAVFFIRSHERSKASWFAALSLLPVMLGAVMALLADPRWRYTLASRLEEVPALDRLAPLIVDFESGVEAGGSRRATAWESAAAVIEMSPIIGIGVGTYREVSVNVTGVDVLAHNTFLQLAAEWGLIFAVVFFVGVIALLLKKPSQGRLSWIWLSTRDAIFVMLVGSVGISLNNARLFWFLLGIILAIHLLERNHEKKAFLNVTGMPTFHTYKAG